MRGGYSAAKKLSLIDILPKVFTTFATALNALLLETILSIDS